MSPPMSPLPSLLTYPRLAVKRLAEPPDWRPSRLALDVFVSHPTAVGRNPRAASLRRVGGRERGGTPAPRLVEVGSGRLGRGRGPPRAPRAPHGALGAAGVGSAGGAACGRGRP